MQKTDKNTPSTKKLIESTKLKQAITQLQTGLKKNPQSVLKFMYEDPGTKRGEANCFRDGGRELVYFSKSRCLILDTQTGRKKKEQALPKEIVWGDTPRFKLTGSYLNKTENTLIILNQETYVTDLPYFWLYNIEKNKVEFFKFMDPTVRVIHNHGFEREIYFTKHDGFKKSDTLFDRDSPNWRPEEKIGYPGLCLFKLNLKSKKVEFLMRLSNHRRNRIAYQFILDLKFHKKPIIWYFENRINHGKLTLKGISPVERKIIFVKDVKGFEMTEPGDFQEGCDMMDYLSFCICLEKKFHIYDLEFFESKHLYFEKLNRKAEMFQIRDPDELDYAHVSAIYDKQVEEELNDEIKRLKVEGQENIYTKKVENLILLYSKFKGPTMVQSQLLILRPIEERIFKDFKPTELIHNLVMAGYAYNLNLIHVPDKKKILRSLSNDCMGNPFYFDDGLITYLYFIKDFCFFLGIKIDYETGTPHTWGEAFVNCSKDMYAEIEAFASKDTDIELKMSGDPVSSYPKREFAVFRVTGNFVIFEIAKKKCRWRTPYNKDLLKDECHVHELDDNANRFFVAIAYESEENERIIQRKLYEYKKKENDEDEVYVEKLLLDFKDHCDEDCDHREDMKYFFFREGEEFKVYYIAKEGQEDSPFIYCYDTKSEALDAVSYNEIYLMSPVDQYYLKGDNFTIFPKKVKEKKNLDENGEVIHPSVFQLKEKKVLYYEPPEILTITYFVFSDEKEEYEIQWAGFRDGKFFLWVVFPNQQLLVYSEHDVDKSENRILKRINIGVLENEFRQRRFFYDEYVFQPASTGAFYCFLRERYIEKNYDAHFEKLNQPIEYGDIFEKQEYVKRENHIYEQFVEKIQNCLMLLNVDESYVNKKLKILEILHLIEDDEITKKYIFYTMSTSRNKRGEELENAIEDFVNKFPDPEKTRKLVHEVLRRA